MKILVVDDNHVLSMILADHLRELGHRVVPAYDGKLALAFCEQTSYDWVVIDLVLPKLNGVDVLERLRLKNRPAGLSSSPGSPNCWKRSRPGWRRLVWKR